MTDEGLIGDDAERVQVPGGGGHVSHRLLGSEILGRAHDHAGGRHRTLVDPGGDAEIGELSQTLPVDEDIGRLDVAMDDAGIVHDLKGAGDLGENRQDLRGGQGALLAEDVR